MVSLHYRLLAVFPGNTHLDRDFSEVVPRGEVALYILDCPEFLC